MGTRRVVIGGLKGGLGKSSTAVTLAVGLARRGVRVLLVDADPSANATWVLTGGQGGEPPTLGDVLLRESSALEAIRPTSTPGLDLLPADARLGGVNVTLAQQLGRDVRMRNALADLDYAAVLIDTGPTLTTLLCNALVAVDEVLVTVDSSTFGALGLVAMEDLVSEVRDAYNPALKITGLVLTKFSRTVVAQDVEKQLRKRYGPLVCRTVIPLAADVERAASHATTVLELAPASAAAKAYESLVTEVFGNVRTAKAGRKTQRPSRKPDAA